MADNSRSTERVTNFTQLRTRFWDRKL